jgi:uncharacterized protein (UPF0332 family)
MDSNERFYGKEMKQFKDCLKRGKLKKFNLSPQQIQIELKAAWQDLQEAQDRLGKRKYKYATITAYYSLFHSARALLYLRGFREKSHYCLKVAIEQLFVKEKILEPEFVEYFEEAMGLREAADYQSIFSRDGASRAIKRAKDFLKKAKEIIKEFLK